MVDKELKLARAAAKASAKASAAQIAWTEAFKAEYAMWLISGASTPRCDQSCLIEAGAS